MVKTIKTQSCLLILVIFIPAIVLGSDNKKRAEDAYNQAVFFLQQKDTTRAVEYLKKAIRFNYKLAKAHNQLAIIYMNEGTVYGRFKATFEIEKAIRFDPKNEEYRYNQAILNLKKGMSKTAERQFKKILEKNPDNYQCCLHLAAIKEDELLHYQNMISIDPNSDGIIYFQEFADKMMGETADYYRKAISLRPQETEPYYRLALVFYEFNEFDEMAQLLESAVRINPKDKNAHLYLGLAYHSLKKFELASREFEYAKKLMSPEEWALMESIEPILSDSMKVEFLALGPREKYDFVNEFWRQNEPFYLSEVNERRLEHYCRVAYANLRFSDAKKNIEGWKTDMGKVYIRYGKPEHRYRTRPYIGATKPGSKNPVVHSKEIWLYPDFRFVFEDEYLSGTYSFARSESPEFDYKTIYENMVKEKPQFYQMTPDSMTFPVPSDVVRFVNLKDSPDITFSYAIPLDSIRYEGILPVGKNIKSGLFVFDENWKKIFEKREKIKLLKEDFVRIDGQPFFASLTSANLAPGKYYYALEFEDDFSEKRAKIHAKLVVDNVDTDQVKISEILLAKKIEPVNFSSFQTKDDFQIYPNPLHKYQAQEAIAVYFEIYHLQLDATKKSHYRIDYTFGEDPNKVSFLNKALMRLGIKRNPGIVTSSYEYSADKNRVVHYQYLNFLYKPSTQQKLTIQVTDLVSGKSDKQSISLQISSEEKK